MTRTFGLLLLLGALVCWTPASANDTPLRLAVSANFAPALNKILNEYREQTGTQYSVTVASSGTLFAQIQHGAPFDIFLSADAARPEQLVEQQQAKATALFTYARGKLAYLTTDEAVKNADDVIAQLKKRDARLAIAHPRLAPYGLAARQTLENLSLWQTYQPDLVRGKNVLQTLQYFDTGNVEHALVAASLVVNRKSGYVLIPDSMYQPIIQKLVIPSRSKRYRDAMQFVCFLLSSNTQMRLEDQGYLAVTTPEQCINEQ